MIVWERDVSTLESPVPVVLEDLISGPPPGGGPGSFVKVTRGGGGLGRSPFFPVREEETRCVEKFPI